SDGAGASRCAPMISTTPGGGWQIEKAMVCAPTTSDREAQPVTMSAASASSPRGFISCLAVHERTPERRGALLCLAEGNVFPEEEVEEVLLQVLGSRFDGGLDPAQVCCSPPASPASVGNLHLAGEDADGLGLDQHFLDSQQSEGADERGERC